MVVLPGPYEIHELMDLESRQLTVLKYELGDVVIHPRYPGAPAEKTIHAMRIFVGASDKPHGPPYWDITSQTLIAQLEPLIRAPRPGGLRVKLTAHGTAPSKRYAVEVLP